LVVDALALATFFCCLFAFFDFPPVAPAGTVLLSAAALAEVALFVVVGFSTFSMA
jgi:hypothetical protein